MQVYAGLEN